MGKLCMRLFAPDLTPLGVSWGGEPWAVWSSVIPDAVIALGCFVLALTLLHLTLRRRGLAGNGIVLMVGAFILACGLTHAMEVYTTWHAAFRLAGAVKIVAAAASLGAAACMVRLEPKIRRAPGLEEALALDQTLSAERGERRAAERLLGESQERLHLLIEGVQDYAIFMLDPQGVIISWNAGAERIKGYRAEEVLGRHFTLFYSAEDVAAGVPGRELATAVAEGVCRTEGQRIRKDGSRFQAHVTITALRDAQGQLKGFAKVTRDITQQAEAEARLKAFNQDLESMVQAKTQELLQSQKLESMGLLAGGIAHDFNNLLGAILGNLGLAQMEISPMAPARARLETIEALVVRASDLARQMLAYSGRGKFQLKTLNLNDLVREMTHLLGISISKKAVIRYGLDLGLPSIEADPTQLQQVVMNLVINASDAIGERSGVITIGTHSVRLDEEALGRGYAGQKLAAGHYVCLQVADNGAGMTPEIMNRIFDPFFTTKFTGRGLGLAAIQGIVRGHHGGIQVQSEPGRGTTFRIIFPATSLPVDAEVPKELAAAYQGAGTVLVVDDEESIRAMAMGILGHIGFRALQAEDGLEALKLLRRHSPEISLVIMDLTMPHLDGEETYRALRQEGFTTPVILSSGFNEMEAVNRFMGKGLAGFLQKPYRAADLVKLVRSVLDRDAPEA